MIVDQRERRELQEALVEAIGAEATDTLMDHLPPVGRADVATKHDLGTLQTVLATRIDGTEGRIMAHLHQELHTELYRTITVVAAIMSILLGAYTAVVKLA